LNIEELTSLCGVTPQRLFLCIERRCSELGVFTITCPVCNKTEKAKKIKYTGMMCACGHKFTDAEFENAVQEVRSKRNK